MNLIRIGLLVIMCLMAICNFGVCESTSQISSRTKRNTCVPRCSRGKNFYCKKILDHFIIFLYNICRLHVYWRSLSPYWSKGSTLFGLKVHCNNPSNKSLYIESNKSKSHKNMILLHTIFILTLTLIETNAWLDCPSMDCPPCKNHEECNFPEYCGTDTNFNAPPELYRG